MLHYMTVVCNVALIYKNLAWMPNTSKQINNMIAKIIEVCNKLYCMLLMNESNILVKTFLCVFHGFHLTLNFVSLLIGAILCFFFFWVVKNNFINIASDINI